MSLKFKLLENRVTQLEREVCRLYKAVQVIAKETGVNLTEANELLGIPPYDPDTGDSFEKKDKRG